MSLAEESNEGDPRPEGELVPLEYLRNKKGRFVKGNHGGPGRRKGVGKRGAIDKALREYLEQVRDEEGRLLVARTLVDVALGIDTASGIQLMAMKLLLERVEGKPRLAKEVNDETPRAWSILLDAEGGEKPPAALDAAEEEQPDEDEGPRDVELEPLSPPPPAAETAPPPPPEPPAPPPSQPTVDDFF